MWRNFQVIYERTSLDNQSFFHTRQGALEH